MKLKTILFLLAVSPWENLPAAAEVPDDPPVTCICNDPGGMEITYRTVPPDDQPWADSDAFDLAVQTCSIGIDELDGREKIFIFVRIVGEDSPLLDIPFVEGAVPEIFYNGAWWEEEVLKTHFRESGECTAATS